MSSTSTSTSCTIVPITDSIGEGYTVEDYIADLEDVYIHVDSPTYSMRIGTFCLNDRTSDQIMSLLSRRNMVVQVGVLLQEDADIMMSGEKLTLACSLERDGEISASRFTFKTAEESILVATEIMWFVIRKRRFSDTIRTYPLRAWPSAVGLTYEKAEALIKGAWGGEVVRGIGAPSNTYRPSRVVVHVDGDNKVIHPGPIVGW